MTRCEHGGARRQGSHELVADVLVEDVCRLPQRVHVDAGVQTDAAQRLGQRLTGDPVERQCKRIDRARDELGARAGGSERHGERAPAGTLRVDPDGQPTRLGQGLHELLRSVRLERTGRVVEENAHRAELGQHPRALDQRLDLAGAARAVDEPGLEVALRGDDRLRGLAQVRDVVERVVEPEDVDAVRGGRGDEAAGEVGVDGTRADEEPAAQREPERRLDARLEGANPLPRALDAALDRRVEAASARDLEIGEAGLVEDLRESQLLGGGNPPGERLLPEQANRRVGERRHARSLPRKTRASRGAFLLEPPGHRPCAFAGVREQRPRQEALLVVDGHESNPRVAAVEPDGTSAGRKPEAEPVAAIRARRASLPEHLRECLLTHDRAREERAPERRHVRGGRVDATVAASDDR